MARPTKRYRRVALPVAVVASLCAFLFASSLGSAGVNAKAPPGPKPFTKAEWKALIAKATSEGNLTIYTSWFPDSTRNMNDAFQKQYGITVVVNRANDDVIAQQLTADQAVGKVPDIYLGSGKPTMLGIQKNGWAVDARGPNLFHKRYDRKVYMLGKAWDWATSSLGLVWNTKDVPQGLTSPRDLLKPQFKGKIGVIDPRGGETVMDLYLWLDEKFGPNFVRSLATQKPKIYSDGFSLTQAIASGEIIAGFPGLPPTAFTIKAAGGPVDYNTKAGTFFNSPYWGVILKDASHPAAAQLWANFVLSPQGQALINKWEGSVLPNIPNTFYDVPRKLNLKNFTRAKVTAYLDNWDQMFRG
jgi:iron(III) transport system substrate-binding protein